jgi:mannosyl-3-phosphoglycerate phosphatase family protein
MNIARSDTMKGSKAVVFTDLDATLLDHFDYNFKAAIDDLQQLEQQGIPVICTTSKTFAELLEIRIKLSNRHPMIVENGAAIIVPQGYFAAELIENLPSKIKSNDSHHGFISLIFSQPRSYWQAMLKALKPSFRGCWKSFDELGCDGIMQATGLSAHDARLANQRDFGEPLLWLGSDQQQQNLINALQVMGAHVLQGGRFLHVSGAGNKADAMTVLKQIYTAQTKQIITCYALGDSQNDLAMLKAADKAALVRSPVNQLSQTIHAASIYHTTNTGPEGWAEAIQHWQLLINQTSQGNNNG